MKWSARNRRCFIQASVGRTLRCSSYEFGHGVWAPAQQSRGSVILYSVLLCTKKMETRVQIVPSLNTGTADEQNRGSAEKCSQLRQRRQAELAAALSTCSALSCPCFSVKIVYNYGLREKTLNLKSMLGSMTGVDDLTYVARLFLESWGPQEARNGFVGQVTVAIR